MPKEVRKKYKVIVGECLSCGWNTKLEIPAEDDVDLAKHVVKSDLDEHLASNGHSQSNIRVLEHRKTEKEPTELEEALAGQRRHKEKKKERQKSYKKLKKIFALETFADLSEAKKKAVKNGNYDQVGNKQLKTLAKGPFDIPDSAL